MVRVLFRYIIIYDNILNNNIIYIIISIKVLLIKINWGTYSRSGLCFHIKRQALEAFLYWLALTRVQLSILVHLAVCHGVSWCVKSLHLHLKGLGADIMSHYIMGRGCHIGSYGSTQTKNCGSHEKLLWWNEKWTKMTEKEWHLPWEESAHMCTSTCYWFKCSTRGCEGNQGLVFRKNAMHQCFWSIRYSHKLMHWCFGCFLNVFDLLRI